MSNPVVKRVEVSCTAETAFDVFVNQISIWWPLDTHAASVGHGASALHVEIDPRVGGKIVETMHDGATDHWGDVLVFDPPARFAMSWHPGNNKDAQTQVDVQFEETNAGTCLVTLTHTGWEAWAEKGNDIRGGYDSGWDTVLGQCFARRANTA